MAATMSWVRVDDNAAFHGKIVAAGNEAVGVWIRCLAWCNANLTDGVVPRQIALIMTNQDAGPIERLLGAGLFEPGDDDQSLLIHDFSDYQASAAEVRAKRADLTAKRSAAGKAGAAKRWGHGKMTNGMASDPGLPMAKNGKPAGDNSGGSEVKPGNTKTRGYNSKNGKRLANAKQNDSPIPSPPTHLDIHDNAEFDAAAIEQLATPQLGRLGGKAMGALVQLAPLLGWEIKAALGADSPNWGYFVKVVENTRTEVNKPKPPAGKKRNPPQPPSDFGRAEPSTEFGNGDQSI